MSSIFIPSLATVRKFGGMGHGQVQRRARRTVFGAKWPLGAQWIRGFGENSAENYA